jgi:quercetin dioxygenase-like cupin family protein
MIPRTAAKELIRIGQVSVRFLLEGKDTSGQMAMFEFMVPAGAKVPVPHYHKAYDETVYGLQGTLTFNVDEQPIEIGPGETQFIPRGVVHGFHNFGQQDAKALAVITPGILGSDFFKETGEIVNAGGPPDIEKIKVVLLKHGLVPVMPKG